MRESKRVPPRKKANRDPSVFRNMLLKLPLKHSLSLCPGRGLGESLMDAFQTLIKHTILFVKAEAQRTDRLKQGYSA